MRLKEAAVEAKRIVKGEDEAGGGGGGGGGGVVK